MGKDDGLAFTVILVEDLGAVFCRDVAHDAILPKGLPVGWASLRRIGILRIAAVEDNRYPLVVLNESFFMTAICRPGIHRWI
jgi:hypothetical protein